MKKKQLEILFFAKETKKSYFHVVWTIKLPLQKLISTVANHKTKGKKTKWSISTEWNEFYENAVWSISIEWNYKWADTQPWYAKFVNFNDHYPERKYE